MRDNAQSRCPVIRGFPCPAAGPRKLFLVINLVMGKAPNVHSLGRGKFLMSLQGPCCLWLKITHAPSNTPLCYLGTGRLVLNPFKVTHPPLR